MGKAEIKDRIVAALADAGSNGATVQELADRLNVPYRQAVAGIAAAQQARLVYRIGFGRWAVARRQDQTERN